MVIVFTRNTNGRIAGQQYTVTRWQGMKWIRARAAKWVADSPGETPAMLHPFHHAPKDMPERQDRMLRIRMAK